MAKGQRLIDSEISKRAVIKPSKSMRLKDDGVRGIMYFGENNNYPQIMEKLIDGSVTAKNSANIYAKFLTGGGFQNEQINGIVVGTDEKGKEITLKKLLRQFCKSISRNQGSYVHCNYTREGKIKNTHLKPFKTCRFSISDDQGYSAKILVYNNWQKDKDLGKYDASKVKTFNVFNSRQNVIVEQIKNAGGIKKYKGQIYFLFLDDDYFYPLSTFDEVYLDCDTEAQLALFKNRLTRNGFFKKTVVRIQESLTEEEKANLAQSCRKSLGVDGDGMWIIEDEPDENGEFTSTKGFKIDQLDSDIEDDRFENWPKELANNIRKAAQGVPAVLIDYEENKLGATSGEALIEATNFYNAVTKDDRAAVSEAFKEIFSNFDNETLANNQDWTIKPLNLIEEEKLGTANTDTTE